ncbi:MAG: Sulfotransferase family [Rhodobacteraceae bacterium HLUCCO18]|nr:MAG: Sulfotransferase family [Rhodobacteraceae bacterium HLUCCO18]
MPPRILYIAGYSRSGSTLLDMALAGSGRIASTGELTYLQDDAALPDRRCTCGAAYGACCRYAGWLAARPANEADLVRGIERRGNLRRLLTGTVAAEEARAYRAYAQGLFGHIGAATGAEIVVDSSKSARDAAGRPLALSLLAGLDVRILHLTRDPRHTMQSYVTRGSNWVLEGHRAPRPFETWRPILGWTMANRIARRLGQEFGAERYLHLKFEDVLADPASAFGRIGTFAGIDLGDVIDHVEASRPFFAGHMVGGNRARLRPQTIRPDTGAPARLPRAHALCLNVVARPLAREFGYG